MDPMIGKTISKHTATILSGLLADGADEAEVNIIAAALANASKPQPAEDLVPEWAPFPALLSDEEFTFAKGTSQAVKIRLKKLGGDYYWSHLLPALNEWAGALYGSRAIELMQAAQGDPVGFIQEIFQILINRPPNDRTKVSFYQFAASTFSTPDQLIEPEFYAICPPDEQMGSILKLVAANRANFTGWWGGLPGLLRLEATSLYLNSIRCIQVLNESVITAMQLKTMELQKALLSNGGVPDTGAEEFGPLPAENPALI